MSFVGSRLQALRKKAGLSQSQLAKKAGIPVGSLQAWEIDKRSPRSDALLALARALDVPLEALLEEKPRKRK